MAIYNYIPYLERFMMKWRIENLQARVLRLTDGRTELILLLCTSTVMKKLDQI